MSVCNKFASAILKQRLRRLPDKRDFEKAGQ